MSKAPTTSYGQTLKSSALVGGSTAFNLVIGFVRNKVLALLLGTSGVGFIGMYNSITTTATALAGMGITNSGVRQIAEAVGSGDEARIARTVKTLRRASWLLGLAGTLLVLAACQPIARVTFGDTHHTGAVALLSVTVLLLSISGAQGALVQGMRRVGDLARLTLFGGLWGTVLGIPVVYFWRAGGIVPMLLVVALMTILSSWWYARKVPVARIVLGWRETWQEARGLLRIGLAFMVSGLAGQGAAYLIRLIIFREQSADAAGLYQAAFGIAGQYVGFILTAMGADFYPRLTATAQDHHQTTRLVNEQVEIAILLAVPGVLAALTLAPWILQLLYSHDFLPATELLRWQLVGVLIRVLAFPIGFVLVARGESTLFILTEVATNAVSVILSWWFLKWFGLAGLGMAYVAMYGFCLALVWFLVRRLSAFRWSRANLRLGAILAPAVIGVCVAQSQLPAPWNVVVGLAVTAGVGGFALRTLVSVIGPDGVAAFRGKLRRLLGR